MASKREADRDYGVSVAKRPRSDIVPSSTVTPVQKEPIAPKIDRTKRCPLLLRMFPRVGGHHKVTDYQRASEPDGELSIHTWMDADLRELAELVKQTQSAARHRDAIMEFALVFPDKRGINVMRTVGAVHATQPGADDERTLHEVKFQIGDFVDVAILVPSRGPLGMPDRRFGGASMRRGSRR